MKILVISERHNLLPIAWRLKKEGNDIDVIVVKDRYERAWEGIIDKVLTGKDKSNKNLKWVLEQAEKQGTIVLTDSRRIAELAPPGLNLYRDLRMSMMSVAAPSVVLSGWYEDEIVNGLTSMVVDWGLWPKGLGPYAIGGITQYNHHRAVWEYFLGQLPLDEMKADEYRGPFQVHLVFDAESGQFVRTGFNGGWGNLLTHTWLNNQIISKWFKEDIIPPPARYTVTIPISTPPYPLMVNMKPAQVEIIGLSQDDYKNIYLYDVTMDAGTLYTGGTDGLIMAPTGAGELLSTARADALSLALRVQLPQKQVRDDVGAQADLVLRGYEKLGIL